jgi:hypothetical protein
VRLDETRQLLSLKHVMFRLLVTVGNTVGIDYGRGSIGIDKCIMGRLHFVGARFLVDACKNVLQCDANASLSVAMSCLSTYFMLLNGTMHYRNSQHGMDDGLFATFFWKTYEV